MGGIPMPESMNGNATGSNPQCFTRFDVAEAFRVSVRTVDRMIAAGELQVRRIRGKAVRIPRSEVERFLQGNPENPSRMGQCNLKSTQLCPDAAAVAAAEPRLGNLAKTSLPNKQYESIR